MTWIGEGRYIGWLGIKCVLPKMKGGLGFINMELFNQALLAKQGWHLINSPYSLVSRTLKAKYFTSVHFLEAEIGSDASYV